MLVLSGKNLTMGHYLNTWAFQKLKSPNSGLSDVLVMVERRQFLSKETIVTLTLTKQIRNRSQHFHLFKHDEQYGFLLTPSEPGDFKWQKHCKNKIKWFRVDLNILTLWFSWRPQVWVPMRIYLSEIERISFQWLPLSIQSKEKVDFHAFQRRRRRHLSQTLFTNRLI